MAYPASLPWIEKLVAFDTIAQTPNTELLAAVAQEFERFGLEPHYTWNEDQTRGNLFVTLPAADGSTDGGIVLSGHTDVVPVEGQRWDTDPFTVALKDGKLYGRGVADMKSYLGAALTALPRFAAAQLARPIHFAFTYDEEIGCVGAPALIEEFVSRGIAPDFAVVGEPSSMQVIAAHKGAHRGRITLHGIAKHGSLAPHGVNALEVAARIITFFEELAANWAVNGPQDHSFVVPHSTGGINFARGGIQYNIVAEDVVLEYDVRTVPAHPSQEMLALVDAFLETVARPALEAKAARAEQLCGAAPGSLVEQVGIEHELLALVPALDTQRGDAVLELGAQLTGLAFDPDGDLLKVTYGTEGGQFQQLGKVATVVCGPGDIAQAHTPNEWVTIEQVEECERFMERVLQWAVKP